MVQKIKKLNGLHSSTSMSDVNLIDKEILAMYQKLKDVKSFNLDLKMILKNLMATHSKKN
jgi:hypothetical protein